MRSILLTSPMQFSPVELPSEPPASDTAVTVRVRAGGICGSDGPFVRGVPARFGGPSHPDGIAPSGSPMHEVVGEIEDPGTSTDFRKGDRVVGWATGFDGMSEVVATDPDSLAVYSETWSPTDAVLLQPLACVIHAVDRLGDVRGRRCTVLGLGPIGALFAHVLDSAGALVDGVDPVDRSDFAGPLGLRSVTRSHSAAWARHLAPEDQSEIVVETVGHQTATLNHAITAVAPQGTVLYFGVPDEDIYPIDMEKMVRKHLTLMTGGTLNRRRALTRADEYLRAHPDLARALITHVVPVSEATRAYAEATTPAPGRLKVVIDMAEWWDQPSTETGASSSAR
ncbi:zinc-dependent alcohol dehydrogenase [Dietzia aurantiaca]|uniref:Zinc-binding dehydrogenase n=1 Tax=Dietzia aurantiaca TaxID=983873 RepID=A0ABV9PR37_9ACTN